MSVFTALILGIVQGICEFLPISSSGHLLLLQKLFGISEPTTGLFNVMLHVATLIAVCIVYRDILLRLIRHPVQKTVLYLIIATVPTVIFTLIMKKVDPLAAFMEKGDSGLYLGVSFIFTSVLLLICDLMIELGRKRTMAKMGLKDALIIGGMQCLGVFPGVSRSGSTITGALISGLDRKSAADFSFLMSIPAILGATVLEGYETVKNGIEISGNDILFTVVGMIAAGFTGYFAIKFMIRVITKKRLWGFALYACLLGIAVIAFQIIGVAGF